MWTPNEQRAIRDEIKTLLSLLWRTGEIFLHKPDVAAERRNIMHYLYSGVPRRAAGARSAGCVRAWEHLGFDAGSAPGARAAAAVQPEHLGGRRSGRSPAGHRRTSRARRSTTCACTACCCSSVSSSRSAGSRACPIACEPPPPALIATASAISWQRDLGERGRRRSTIEAGRDLAAIRRPDAGAAAARKRLPRRRTSAAGLGTISARRRAPRGSAAAVRVARRRRRLARGRRGRRAGDSDACETFGFHLASLDIRQNSALSRSARSRSCWRPPASSRPTTRTGPKSAGWTSSTASWRRRGRSCARTCRRVPRPTRCWRRSACWPTTLRDYGPDGLGALIVSMTRSASDLLGVYLLAREVGLTTNDADGAGLPAAGGAAVRDDRRSRAQPGDPARVPAASR